METNTIRLICDAIDAIESVINETAQGLVEDHCKIAKRELCMALKHVADAGEDEVA